MSPDDRWRSGHRIEATVQALDFVRSRTRQDLDTDAMRRLALTRAVETVGMRNRLVRAYFDVDRDILWDTVQLFLPELLRQLRPSVNGDQ